MSNANVQPLLKEYMWNNDTILLKMDQRVNRDYILHDDALYWFIENKISLQTIMQYNTAKIIQRKTQ